MRFIVTTLVVLSFATLVASPPVLGQNRVRFNRTIELLEQDKPVFGIFSHDRSPSNARSLAGSKLDFVFIDMEHAPFDVETLRTFLLSMTDKRAILEKGNLQPNVTPIVRIPTTGRENLQFITKQVMDVGVFGVMFPYVNTRQEALNAVRSARYPQKKGVADFEPTGLRGRFPLNAVWYWGISMDEYFERADVWPLDPNGEILTVIQIETAQAVENIAEILSVPGIGAIFVGPSDLSTSMGFPDNPNAPEVEEAIQKVLAACKAKDIPIGITTDPQTVEKRVREGFNFVTVGLDGGITPEAARALDLGLATSGRQ